MATLLSGVPPGRFRRLSVFWLLLASWTTARLAEAEPWLASRYARNCAGCHAPHRFNVAAKERRCALSCQGCHVNPSGGGLRNYHGRWNSERWLRSFRSDALEHERAFAPFPAQAYGKAPIKDIPQQQLVEIVKKGFRLVETPDTVMNEEAYFQTKEEYITVPTNTEFLYRVPQRDPYRAELEQRIDGGMDMRWLLQKSHADVGGVGSDRKLNFLMNIDFGLRMRPFYRSVHLVYESRLFGGPQPDYERSLNTSTTRSLYLMLDRIPYNIYVMGGIYRPMFGNPSPDHTALGQRMVAFVMSDGKRPSQRVTFNSVSIGAAPNLPYGNLHLIGRQAGDPDDHTRGFALNLGIRGVRMGQSINYSYWRTDNKQAISKTRVEMHSINAMVMLGPAVISYEGLSLARDNPAEDFRLGGVHLLEAYVKTWREIYLIATLAMANTMPDLRPGKSRQTKAGLRFFLIPGFEVQTTYDLDQLSPRGGVTAHTKAITALLHAYL